MANAVKGSTKVITGKIRMCYVNLFTPRAITEGEEPKYSLCVLIPKSDKETISKINSAVEEAKRAGAVLWGGKIPLSLKAPLRDADEEKPDAEEFAGHYFLNAISKLKPGVVNKNCQEITEEAQVYSGCYGRVSLNFYAFNQSENQGIGCGLQNVQKLMDGEVISGRTRAEDDFAQALDDDILG
jgi:hypothetical protein